MKFVTHPNVSRMGIRGAAMAPVHRFHLFLYIKKMELLKNITTTMTANTTTVLCLKFVRQNKTEQCGRGHSTLYVVQTEAFPRATKADQL